MSFQRMLSYIIFATFIFYWLITLFFILPKNPLNLSTPKVRNYFDDNFFQRWSFFAPPPTYNTRLFFIFKDTVSQKERIFEGLTPILKEKSNSTPFNTKYQVLDYTLSTSIIYIEENIKFTHDLYYDPEVNMSLNIDDSILNKRIIAQIENSSSFETLKRYAKKVAIQNGIVVEENICQIQILKSRIPKFVDKDQIITKEDISTTFISSQFKFSPT